jgi:malonyl CoA-acyl carrier protein transacylase
MVIINESNSCFHMAITGTNTDIENAKAVCSQAVLYRSTEDDPDLYCSVYDNRTQKVFFCLCDPAKQEFEDASCYSMQGEADKVIEWLKTYIVSNAEVLRR